MKTTSYSTDCQKYINLVPKSNVFELFHDGINDLLKCLIMTSNKKAETSYETGKWNIKELLQHLMDTERIFAYRALAIARGEEKELLSFDQERYAQLNDPNQRALRDIMEEMKRLRATTIDLFKSFDRDALDRYATVGGELLSVKQMALIIIGHEMHHLEVLQTKYL